MEKNKLIFIVKMSEEGMKIRPYLKDVKNLSSRMIKGAAMDGRISVNNNRVKLNYVIKFNDEISFDVEKEEGQNIEPEKMDIDVVYEDNDLIVVNKQPGIVVHPTKSYSNGTLSNGLLYYFKEKGERCIVRLVSRLDMDTSGLIMIAKNQFAHMSLARDMHKEEFQKSYLAIVHGNLKEKKGVINLPIYRTGGANIRRIVDERGQESVTCFNVLESYNKGDLVELTLKTGRTHQIRVHMTYIGHPLYGDNLYGGIDDKEYIGRQALHAYKLSFPQPRTREVLNLEIGLPKDLKELVEKMKK